MPTSCANMAVIRYVASAGGSVGVRATVRVAMPAPSYAMREGRGASRIAQQALAALLDPPAQHTHDNRLKGVTTALENS